MPNLLNALEVKERLQVKPAPMLVEALPEKYFRDRHLPGAINLPHDSSDPEIRRILPDLEAEIIVYGASIDFWRRPAGHQAPRQRARHAVPDILGTNFLRRFGRSGRFTTRFFLRPVRLCA
jgi:hypothetical protein